MAWDIGSGVRLNYSELLVQEKDFRISIRWEYEMTWRELLEFIFWSIGDKWNHRWGYGEWKDW